MWCFRGARIIGAWAKGLKSGTGRVKFKSGRLLPVKLNWQLSSTYELGRGDAEEEVAETNANDVLLMDKNDIKQRSGNTYGTFYSNFWQPRSTCFLSCAYCLRQLFRNFDYVLFSFFQRLLPIEEAEIHCSLGTTRAFRRNCGWLEDDGWPHARLRSESTQQPATRLRNCRDIW